MTRIEAVRRTCSIPGCLSGVRARGYCAAHYTRWCRYGDPQAVSRFDPDWRFWPKINKNGPNGCWEWTGALTLKGYGTFRFRGVMDGAHRVVWVLLVGEIPDGLLVLHKCDNRRCVNPEHLFLGTQQDNIHDAIEKGRLDPWAAARKSQRERRFRGRTMSRCRKHQWAELYHRPTSRGALLTYVLHHLADFQMCTVCKTVGAYSRHSLRRFHVYSPEGQFRHLEDAMTWNAEMSRLDSEVEP